MTEADVEAVLPPADAVAAVATDLGADDVRPRGSRLAASPLVVLAGTASERALVGVSVAGGPSAALMVVLDEEGSDVVALVEARRLRALRVAATSALATGAFAREGAASIGIIGCGEVGRAHIECLRATLPALTEVAVYCRDEARREAFAAEHGAEAVTYGREAAERHVVVTATPSKDPVLRGDWLRPGTLVCAVGATRIEARELDNLVLERAAFVCCDSLDDARAAAGDLSEPIGRGVLDWLEVHELREAIVPGFAARQGADDIVVYKAVGTAELDLALAALVMERLA